MLIVTARLAVLPLLVFLVGACAHTQKPKKPKISYEDYLTKKVSTLVASLVKDLPKAKEKGTTIAVLPPVLKTKLRKRVARVVWDRSMHEFVRQTSGSGAEVVSREKALEVGGNIRNADQGRSLLESLGAKKAYVVLLFVRDGIDSKHFNVSAKAISERQSLGATALAKMLRPDAYTAKPSVWGKWWLWTAVGTAVVGGTVAAVAATSGGGGRTPQGPSVDYSSFE